MHLHVSSFPRRLPLALIIGLSLAAGATLAQSRDDAVDIEGVSVSGVRASIQKSLVDKRNAIGVVDAISAEDMGKFPDLNLSESLQRISGITLDRNSNGEGSAINLRGLGPEFTRVEVNGMPGMSGASGTANASPFEARSEGTGSSRGFNFEVFASELFSKATVYKTGLAEVDEGGLAGTVRLETPRPLDTQGTKIVGSVMGNYSELARSTTPRTALLFSHNQGDVFGIAASLAWSKTDFASHSIEASSWRPFGTYNDRSDPVSVRNPIIRADDDVRAALIPLGPLYFTFNEERETTGSTLTLQFKPSDTFNVSLDGLYGKLNSKRNVIRYDMPIEGGSNAPSNAVIENGVITSADFTGVQQRVGARFHTADEEYQQLVTRAEWTPNEYWSIRPALGYAKREARRTWDLLSFRLANDAGLFDPGTVNYRLRGDYIDFGSTETDFASNPEDFLFNVFVMRPSHDSERNKQARLDVDRHFADHDHVLKFGARYDDRLVEREASQWRLNRSAGVNPRDLPGLDSVAAYTRFKVSGAKGGIPSHMLTVDKHRIWDVFMPGGKPLDGTFVTDENTYATYTAQETWSVQEKTSSVWTQMDLLFGQWTLSPGMRYLRTEQISSGSSVIAGNTPNQQILPMRVSSTYHGYLPSVTARYDVRADVVLRAAYARTLTRPYPFSLAPSETLSGLQNGTGTSGNPELEPYYANNFDLGAEWYFSSEGLLAANVFYKKISNFIDARTFQAQRTIIELSTGNPVLTTLTFTQPVNVGQASIKGAEVSAQLRFSRLPGALGNLGGILNYSHTESSADFTADGDVRSQGLPGLSKNSVNAVLYYDDGRFDARLAYAWRDRYLAAFADLAGQPRFTKAYGQLDLSINYQVSPNLSIQAQVLNLTQEQRIDQSTARYLPYGVSEVDRRFMFGVRVAF